MGNDCATVDDGCIYTFFWNGISYERFRPGKKENTLQKLKRQQKDNVGQQSRIALNYMMMNIKIRPFKRAVIFWVVLKIYARLDQNFNWTVFLFE